MGRHLRHEGHMPSLDGATAWLNSPPLTTEQLRGRVVVVDFWTYTCINWLRTLPYVRAWAQAYENDGLVVIGVHTPEFGIEHDVDSVRRAAKEMRLEYPIAVDNDYAVWEAFANHYWPALYFVDANGEIRHHHFGEGEYEQSEQVIRQLLDDAGAKERARPPRRSRRPRHRDRSGLGQPRFARDLRRLWARRAVRVPGRRRIRRTPPVRGAHAAPAQPVGAPRALDDRPRAGRVT